MFISFEPAMRTVISMELFTASDMKHQENFAIAIAQWERTLKAVIDFNMSTQCQREIIRLAQK